MSEPDMNSLPLLSSDILTHYTSFSEAGEQAHALLEQQKETWPLLRGNYENLRFVRTRSFEFDGFRLSIQFNPGRMTSSAAKVDEKSIRERKCFLCVPHLPAEQRGILYRDSYLILCNPFPIFPEHFTIPRVAHVPQQIEGELEALLDLAAKLAPRYVVFYNGPKSGASAPDHMHFQAGTRGFMHIDEEYPSVVARQGRDITLSDDVKVNAVARGCHRRFVAFESSLPDRIGAAVSAFVKALQGVSDTKEEPMINVLASYADDRWSVLLFPRARHRPSVFFEGGEKRILLSPAAVDMGGMCITPREEDFFKMTKEDLVAIFEEVTLGQKEFEEAVERWRQRTN
jgi:hypothetical protein